MCLLEAQAAMEVGGNSLGVVTPGGMWRAWLLLSFLRLNDGVAPCHMEGGEQRYPAYKSVTSQVQGGRGCVEGDVGAH